MQGCQTHSVLRVTFTKLDFVQPGLCCKTHLSRSCYNYFLGELMLLKGIFSHFLLNNNLKNIFLKINVFITDLVDIFT